MAVLVGLSRDLDRIANCGLRSSGLIAELEIPDRPELTDRPGKVCKPNCVRQFAILKVKVNASLRIQKNSYHTIRAMA
jgi:hypothetical protein